MRDSKLLPIDNPFLSGLSASALKIMAMLFMLVDHVGVLFFPELLVFRYIGRSAFLMFAFFIAEGAKYSHDRFSYFIRLLILALLTQPIYQITFLLAEKNVVFTLALGLVLIQVIDNISSIFHKDWVKISLSTSSLCIAMILSIYFSFDYDWAGIAAIAMFYCFDRSDGIPGSYIALIFRYGKIEQWAGPGMLLLSQYNGKEGKKLKYLFYVFYPLHIIILYLIKRFV